MPTRIESLDVFRGITIAGSPYRMSMDSGAPLWYRDGRLELIRLERAVIGYKTPLLPPLDLAVSDGAVWTVDTQGLVSRIDPIALRVVRTIRTAPTIRSSLAVADGDLWVAVQQPR